MLTDTQLNKLLTVNGGYAFNETTGWLIGPRAIISPVEPEASTQPIIRPRNAILHTNAGPAKTGWESLVTYWRRKDITGEAHFQVDMAGNIVQAIPVHRRADCNAKANRFTLPGKITAMGAVSFETQDEGYAALATTPWTVPQWEAIVGALTALVVQYGVACTAPTSWSDTGIGYHSQFPEWSIYKGKTCPGAARIRQMDSIRHEVALRVGAYLDPAPPAAPAGNGPETGTQPAIRADLPQPPLRIGDRGEEVRKLQTALNVRRVSPLMVDGYYGPRTEAAVEAFQRATGLVVDGYYGPVTAAKLAEVKP